MVSAVPRGVTPDLQTVSCCGLRKNIRVTQGQSSTGLALVLVPLLIETPSRRVPATSDESMRSFPVRLCLLGLIAASLVLPLFRTGYYRARHFLFSGRTGRVPS
jgi:hypothetical protein